MHVWNRKPESSSELACVDRTPNTWVFVSFTASVGQALNAPSWRNDQTSHLNFQQKGFFKVENNSLELTRIFKESFLKTKGPTTKWPKVLLLNARTQPSFDQTDDGVDAETSLSLSLSASLSLFSALTLFSHAHLWSLKLSLQKGCAVFRFCEAHAAAVLPHAHADLESLSMISNRCCKPKSMLESSKTALLSAQIFVGSTEPPKGFQSNATQRKCTVPVSRKYLSSDTVR